MSSSFDDGIEVPDTALQMVYLTVFIDTLCATISTPVMPFYAKAFNASTASIGYLFAAWSFASTVFAPFLARWSDKYGRRTILVISLMGAGVAALGQGLSLYAIGPLGAGSAFYVFAFFRGFSGVWAAIGAVTQVYISDVVAPAKRPEIFAKLGIAGPLAFTFGPALGGGLAAIGGYNMPIIADGILTLFSSMLVSFYLPETPAFLRMQEEKAAADKSPGTAKAASEIPKAPWQVYVLSLASFFGGLSMSATVSMMALFLNERYKLDALHVGFVYVGMAVVLILTNMFVVKRVKDCFSLSGAICVSNVSQGTIFFMLVYFHSQKFNVWYILACIWFNNVGAAIANASTGSLLGDFTVTANRGKITGMNQMAGNFGRMIGPLMYGHMAEASFDYVWMCAGATLIIKGLLTLLVKPKSQDKKTAVSPAAGPCSYGQDWHDEVGSEDDTREIGNFMANLLEKHHYKWVSNKEDVMRLLEELVPELCVDSEEAYTEAYHRLEMTTPGQDPQSDIR